MISEGIFLESSGEVNIKQSLETQRHHLSMQSRDCRDLNCKESLHISLVRAVDMVDFLEKKQPLEKSLRCNEKDTHLFEILLFTA